MTAAEPAAGILWLRALSSVVEVSGDVPARLRLDLGDLTAAPARAPMTRQVQLRRSGDRWSLHADAGLQVGELSYDDMADHLVGLLNRTALDGDPQRLHLHAACVERDGLGLLLAGASESGKTTMTAGLLERGWSYLTDEMVPLALGDRTIPSYPKPLTFKGWAIGRFAGERRPATAGPTTRVVVPANELGPVASRAEGAVVVFPRFVEGASTHLVAVPPIDAVHELMATTFDAGRFGADSLGTLVDLVARSSCWSLVFGDLASGLDAVEALPPRSAPLTWRVRHGGPSGVVLAEIDGGLLELDLPAAALRTRRTSVATEVPDEERVPACPPSRGAVAPETVARAQRSLEDAGIDSAITARGGLLVAGRDRSHAADLLERDTIGVDLLHGSALAEHADEIIAAATMVRVGGAWCRGVDAAHRLMDACLEPGASPERERLVAVALEASAPVLEQFWDVAERWGAIDQVASALIEHAARAGRLPDVLDRRLRQLPGAYFTRYPAAAPVASKLEATAVLPLLLTGSPWRDHVLGDLAGIERVVGSGRTMWRLATRDGAWAIEYMWARALFPSNGFEPAIQDLAPAVGLDRQAIRTALERSAGVKFTLPLDRRPASGRLEDFEFVSGAQFEGTNALVGYRWDGGSFHVHEVTSHFDRGRGADIAQQLSASFHHQQPFEMPAWAAEHHAVVVSRQGDRDLLYLLGLDVSGLLAYLDAASWPADLIAALRAEADRLDHLRFDVAYDAWSLGAGGESSVIGGTRPAPFSG